MNSRHLLTIGAISVISAATFLMGRATAPVEQGKDPAADGLASRRSSSNRGPDTSGSSSRSEMRSTAGQSPAGKRKANPEDVVAILQTPDLFERSRAWLDFVRSLRADQFPAVIDQLRGAELNGGDPAAAAMLFAAWAKVDPAQALEYAGIHQVERSALFATWIEQDANGAMAWAERKWAAGDQMWLPAILKSMAGVDPARVTRMLESSPANASRSEALNALVNRMVGQGEGAAKAWLATLSDPDLRAEASNVLADKLARQNPAAAKNYLESLPDGDKRTRAMQGIVREFTRKDPQAASDLINSLAGGVGDDLRMNFILDAINAAPEVAVSQIEKLPDQAARDTAYMNAFRIWNATNPAAAKAWMASHTIPASVRAEIEKPKPGMFLRPQINN